MHSFPKIKRKVEPEPTGRYRASPRILPGGSEVNEHPRWKWLGPMCACAFGVFIAVVLFYGAS